LNDLKSCNIRLQLSRHCPLPQGYESSSGGNGKKRKRSRRGGGGGGGGGGIDDGDEENEGLKWHLLDLGYASQVEEEEEEDGVGRGGRVRRRGNAILTQQKRDYPGDGIGGGGGDHHGLRHHYHHHHHHHHHLGENGLCMPMVGQEAESTTNENDCVLEKASSHDQVGRRRGERGCCRCGSTRLEMKFIAFTY